MSVFTALTLEEFTSHLANYGIVTFEFVPVLGGTQNTIYRILTAAGDYLLIIYEKTDIHCLESTLKLMQHLSQQGFPTNRVIPANNGIVLPTIHDKPAILLGYLPGMHLAQLSNAHLNSLANRVGLLHALTSDLTLQLPKTRNSVWRSHTFEKTKPHLSAQQSQLITLAFNKTSHLEHLALPHGIIHADLFRDNLLFDKNSLTGIIDFFDATEGILLYDLAIAAVDSCLDLSGKLDNQRCHYLLKGYEEIRKLTSLEKQAWPALCLLAALSFWLLRLHNLFFPEVGLAVSQKDPKQMEIIVAHELSR